MRESLLKNDIEEGKKKKADDLFRVISETPGKEKCLELCCTMNEITKLMNGRLTCYNPVLHFLSLQIDFKYQGVVLPTFRNFSILGWTVLSKVSGYCLGWSFSSLPSKALPF